MLLVMRIGIACCAQSMDDIERSTTNEKCSVTSETQLIHIYLCGIFSGYPQSEFVQQRSLPPNSITSVHIPNEVPTLVLRNTTQDISM